MKTSTAIVLLACALPLAFALGRRAPSVEKPAPEFHATPSVRLISSVCNPNYGRPRIDVAIQNGSEPLSYATGFVSFGRTTYRGYFQPSNVPPRAMATLTVYGNNGDIPHCSLDRLQTGEGERVNIL